MEKHVIRTWRKKVWWRTLMFAMPALYFLVGISLNQIYPTPAIVTISTIIVGSWLGTYAHGHALDRVYAYVDSEEVAEVQYRRILEAFDGLNGQLLVRKTQEYGDPSFPRRMVLQVNSGDIKRIVLFDWIKGRFYAPRKFRNKRYESLQECVEQG